jgi:hypothetical protein
MMDLSKLPRLSETDKHAGAPPPTQPAPASQSYEARPARPRGAGIGAQVWLSLIIGAILMMVGQNFAKYCIAKATGREYHTNVTWTSGPKAGQEVQYFELSGYTAWTDTGIFLFGLAMVLEAALLAIIFSPMGGKRLLAGVALGVTVLATVLNLWVSIMLLGAGIIPLMSGLAVAFGGYMAMYEWQLLQSLGSPASHD